ncbi:MAG: F0F1 ATP synthase subunit A [Verrucomicrobiota bacterium]|nr:F0F1 ATP synthase subunit A [Verrucomicrobiota bacterium]
MNMRTLSSLIIGRPRWIRLRALLTLCLLAGTVAGELRAAQSPALEAAEHAPAAPAEAHGAGEHHGIPPDAPRFQIGPFSVTNSMVVTWLVALGVILLARYATRQMKDVPDGVQNFWEWLVESLRDFLESIMGRALVRKTFWFFATIFIFILFTNWAGLLPGVGSIGAGFVDAQGQFHLTKPWFRGVNADLNMTLAMATIFFVCWIVWALQANGPGGFILHLFGPKGQTKGLLKVLMIAVFILVGLLEVVSILFRPISLSFRLYGNIFAGENMLESMAQLVPALGWLIPIPFYFMEVLVGLVQALVFMLLTAVFTLLICTHEEGDHPETTPHH